MQRGSILIGLFAAACATTPPEPPALTGDEELNSFAREIEADLEAHAWQDLIAAAAPSHYRTQVVEHGMPEAQYVAELFGLHTVGNSIERGERVSWVDLERIASVDLESLSTTDGSHRLRGTVTLRDGSTLMLRARIIREDGRYSLTGGVG